MIAEIEIEYAIFKTLDWNYRLGMPNAKSPKIPIDTMTLKKFKVREMVEIMGSTQEEVNRILSEFL